MRGDVPGLPSAFPLGSLLPGVYLEDGFVQRFVDGLDAVLAPAHLTLDCLDTYLDPWLTPADFLPWLGSWVGAELDETWPIERCRAMVANAVRIQLQRGTRRGLTAHLRLLTGGQVELHESGGARWSADPGAEPPGSSEPMLRITVRVRDPASVDRSALERTVREARPAHLPYEVEVLAL